MAFLYPALAALVFPISPFFIFRGERSFGVILPFFYILLAWFLSKFGGRWHWILGMFLFCGVSETLVESFWPTYIPFRTLIDARTISNAVGKQITPYDRMRGSPTLDGVVLFEYITNKTLELPPKRLYFFSESREDVRKFFPGVPDRYIRPLARLNAVVVYGVGL